MKYPIHSYAKALSEVIASKKESSAHIEKNFIAILRKNGDEMYAKKILEESERLLRKKDGTKKIVLASARPLKESSHTILGDVLGKNDVCKTVIRPDLVAGVTITINDDLRFDGSLKGKLDKMFG